jgi:putative ABC transport system permease protein
MQLIAGRNFNSNIASDSINSVIINEEMMKEFGRTIQNAVGQTLEGFSKDKTPVVIGVVKNFNFRHAGEEIKPQMFAPFFEQNRPKFYVRVKPGDPTKALSLMQKTWSSIVPDVPLQYNFLDEKLDAFYKTEKRWSSIVGWAGGISILLACLGLFGLAALATINRVKEIGIRKVLGATVTNIITLISKDFLKLIVIALVIASPAAWYFMNKWLQSFAYRIDISWMVFIVSGVFAIVIALITICFQAIKAAVANPAKSLRSE